MNTLLQIDKYWLEVSDLTVFEAAIWMSTYNDPRKYAELRLLNDERRDVYYEVYGPHADYDPWESCGEALDEKCYVIISAIRVGDIALTKALNFDDKNVSPESIYILKSSWLNWCRNNGYSELADRFVRTKVVGIADGAAAASVAENQPEGSNSQSVGNNCKGIPGKIPRTGIGKLVIEAAWQIECDKKRTASAMEVMAQLQEWADAGDMLVTSRKDKHGVDWHTSKGKSKLYDSEACGKALSTWKKSRA
jgi:hypothetical protein